MCDEGREADLTNVVGHEYVHAVQLALGLEGSELSNETAAHLVQALIGVLVPPTSAILQEQNSVIFDALSNEGITYEQLETFVGIYRDTLNNLNTSPDFTVK